MRWPRASTVLAGLATAWCAAMAPVVGSVRVLSRPQSPYAFATPPGKLSLIEVEGLRAAVPLALLPVACGAVLVLIVASHRSRLRSARWARAALALTAAVALGGYLGFVRYLIVGGLAPGAWLLVGAAFALIVERGAEPGEPVEDPATLRRRELQVGVTYVVVVLVLAVAWKQGWRSNDFQIERALFGATMPALVLVFPFVYVVLGLCWNLADQGSAWSGILATAIFLGMFAGVAAFQAWVIAMALRRARERMARTAGGPAAQRPGTIDAHEPDPQHVLR